MVWGNAGAGRAWSNRPYMTSNHSSLAKPLSTLNVYGRRCSRRLWTWDDRRGRQRGHDRHRNDVSGHQGEGPRHARVEPAGRQDAGPHPSIRSRLRHALYQCKPEEVMQRSESRFQYLRWPSARDADRLECEPAWARSTTATSAAPCESLFASLECELLYRRRFATRKEPKSPFCKHLWVFILSKRRHSSL